jgi:four helix bundle protein
MPKIESFEDIEAWKRAREVTRKIYQLSSVGEFSRDFGLRDQIRRSSVSVMSNIAEGFERDGNREFVNFLSIAKGSCGEARSQLYVALDQNFISQDDFDWTYDHLSQTSKMSGGFMNYLRQSDLKGKKFV